MHELITSTSTLQCIDCKNDILVVIDGFNVCNNCGNEKYFHYQ